MQYMNPLGSIFGEIKEIPFVSFDGAFWKDFENNKQTHIIQGQFEN